MQEFDLYGDLELQHAEEKQKATEDLKWKDKYEVALSTIEKLQVEKKELNKKIKQLETNFASLFETARTEIKRKDSQICELRKQKDDICFRRTKPQFAGRQFNENDTVHRSVSSERNHKNPFSGEPRKIISSNTVQSEQFSDDKIPSIFENGKHNFDKINNGEQTARNVSHGKDSIRDRHRNHSKDPEDRSRNRNQSRDRIDDRNRSRHRVDGQNRSTDRVDERNRSQDRKDDRDRSRDRANERDRNRDRDRSRDRLDGRNHQRFDDRNDTKYRDRLEHRKSKKSKSSHKEEKKHDKKRKRHARDNSETKSSDINWDKTDEIDDSHSQRINYTNNEEKSKSSSSRHEQTKPRDLRNKLNNDHTKAQNNDAKFEQNQPKNVPSLQKEKEPKIEILQIEILKDVKELKKNKLKAEKMPKPDPIDPAKVAIEKSNQLLDAIFDDSLMNKSEDPNDDGGLLYDNLLVSTQPANPIPDANKKQDLIKTDENSNLNFQTPQRHNNTKLIHELFGSSPAGSLCSVVRKRNSVITLGDSSSDSDFIPIMNDVRIEKGERTQLAITPKVPIVEQIVIDDSLSENDRTIEKECFEMKPPKNPVRVAANQAENNKTEISDNDLLSPFRQIDSNSENKKFTPKTDENFNLKQHKTTPQKQLAKKFMDDLFGSSPGGSVCGQKYSPSMDESSSDFYFEPNMKHVSSRIDEKTSPNMPIIIDDNYTDDVIRTHNEISHEVKELKQAVAAPSSTEKTVTENVKQLLGLDSSFYSSEDDEIYVNEKLKLNTAGQDIQSPAFEQITPRKHVETVEKSKPNTSNEKSGERPPNSFVQSTNKGNDFQNTCKTSLPENQYQSIINNHSLERNIQRKEFREKEDLKQSSQHNSSNSNSKSILDEDPNQSSISRKRKREKHHHHGHHHHHHKHKHRSKESTKTKSECSSQKYYKNNRNLETNRDKIVTKDVYSKDKSESTSFKNNISKARSSPILVYYDDDQLNEPPQNHKMSEQDQVFFLHCDDISSDDDEIIGKKLNSDECNKKQSNRDMERHIGKIEEIGIMEEQILNDGKKVDIKKPSEENKTEIYKTEETKTNNKVETNKRDMNSLAFKEKPMNSIVSMKDENSEEIGKETKCNEPKEEDHLLALKFKIDENPSNSMAVSVNTEEIDNTHICDVKLDLSKTKSRTNINTSSFSEDFCHINATDSDQQLTQDYHLQNLLETSDKKKDFIEIKHTDNLQTETDESIELEKPHNQIAQETLNTHRKVEVLEKNHKVLSQEVVSTDKRNTDSLNAEQLSNDPNDAVLNVDNTEKIIASNNIDEKSSIAILISDVIKNVSDCELVIREPVKSSCDELPVQQPTSSNEKHDQTNYHEITSKPFDISANETLGNLITYKDEEISCRIPENMSVCSKNEPMSSSSLTDENIPNAIKFYSSHVSPQKSLNSTDDLESPQSNSESVHSGRRKKTKTPRKRSDMCKGDLNKTIQMVSDRYTKLDEVNTSTSIQSESKLKSSEVMSKLSSDKDLRVAKPYCTESELSIKTVAFNSNEDNTLLLEIDNESGEKKPEPNDNKIITEGHNGSFENEKEIVADLFPQEEKPKHKDEKKPECVSKEFTENKNSSLFISGEFPQHDETRNETIEEATLSLLKTQELLTNFPSEISFDKDQQNKNSLINKDFLKTPSPQTTTSEDQVKNANNYVSSSEDTEMSIEPQIEQKVISSEENHPLPIPELKEINEKCVESYSITIKRHRNKKKNIGHSTEVVGNVLIDVKKTNKTLYTVESSLEEESSIKENQRNDYLEKSNNEASMDKTCNSSFNKTKTSITPTSISSKITKQMRQQHPIGVHQMMKHFMDSEHSLVGTCNYPLVIGDDTNVKKRKRNSCSSLDNSDKINETSPIYESAEVQVKRKYRNKTKKTDSTESNEDGKVLNEDHTTKKFLICQADKVDAKRKYTKRTKNLQDNSNNSEDSEVANSSISDESKISSLNDDDVNEEKSPPCAAVNKLPVKTNEDIAKVNNNCISEELRTVLNDDDDNNKKSPNSEIAKVHVKRKYTKKTKKMFNSSNSNEDIEVSSNSNISDESTTISLNDADDDNKSKLKATEHFKSPDDLKQPKKKQKYTRKHSNSFLKSINKSNESGESLDGHEIQFPLNQFESTNSSDKSNSSQSIGESVDEVLHSSNATTYLGLEKSSKSESSNSSLGSSNRANELCENFEGHENLESNSNEFCENRIESHDTPSSPSMLDSVNGSEKNPNKFNFSERTDEIVDKIFHSANGYSELCFEKSTKLKKNCSADSKESTEKVPQSTSESFDKIHHSSKETTEIRFEESSNNFPDETFEEFCHKNTNVSNSIGTCLNNSLSGEDKEHDLTDVKHKKTKKHQKRKLSRSSDSKSEETIVESKRSKNSIEETSQSSSTTCDTTFADKMNIHHESVKEPHRSPSHEKTISVALTPTHHKIFLNDGFSNDPPPVYNANDDDLQYHEIDDRMRSMFQSPTYTQPSNSECIFDRKNNDNEQLVVDETLNNESERTQCDTSISSRKVLLGSNEYVIESTGSHTANVFITRKKSKKRTKAIVTSL